MQTIVIDGWRWQLGFTGFDKALTARGDEAPPLRLGPWSCARHFEALRGHLRCGEVGLSLDRRGYAEAVLDAVAERGGEQGRERTDEHEGWAPAERALALWWASAVGWELAELPGLKQGVQPDVQPDSEGWLPLGGDRSARLRAWSWGERLRAARRELEAAAGETGEVSEHSFDAVAYLEAMLHGCVVEFVDGGRELSDATARAAAIADLDARATRTLLAAVAELNCPTTGDDPLADLPPALAAASLRLCATFGWTPEQLLAKPAPEVQRLLALVTRAEGGSLAPGRREPQRRQASPRRPRLADHPDAVVITFGDDGGVP